MKLMDILRGKLVLLGLLLVVSGCTLREPYPFYQSLDKGWEKAGEAYDVCEQKLADGEIWGEYGLVNCKAEALHKEMRKAGYPYKDLLEEYLFTVRELAMQIDCDETNEKKAKKQMKAAYANWMKKEQQMCEADNWVKEQRRPSTLDMRPLFDKRGFECYNLLDAQK